MASKKINLLPINLAASGDALKILKLINKITLTIFVILLVAASAGGGLLYLSVKKANEISAKNSALEVNIKSQEQTEQKLILIKDRIQKAKILVSQPDATENINKLNKVIATLPSDVTLFSATVDNTHAKFTVVSKTSLSMTSFLTTILQNGDYKNLSLVSFQYNPITGYNISLDVS